MTTPKTIKEEMEEIVEYVFHLDMRGLSQEDVEDIINDITTDLLSRFHRYSLESYKKGYFKGVLDSEYGQITSEELLKEK